MSSHEGKNDDVGVWTIPPDDRHDLDTSSATYLARILVIDDSPEGIRSVIEMLEGHRLRVSVVDDAWQGYQRALASIPDLILLDVRMPRLNGFAICRLLKESPMTRSIPVIFMSCADTPGERLQGLTYGAVDYVVKPCMPAEVLARVRIHLQIRQRDVPPASGVYSNTSHDEVLMHAAMSFIREHLDALPPLNDIARQVGVHDKRLSAIFREHLGLTVFAWVRMERLQTSERLLTDTRLSVQHVAERVGFHKACNFITAFRQKVGLTPSQFRRNSFRSTSV